MKIPYIFDIKRSSMTDGPGIRTVVFLKGCNLDCFWCHNPEGKSPIPQMAFFEEKCVSCGACTAICGKLWEECTVCGNCVQYCCSGARKLYGRRYAVDALLEIIEADKAFFDATGGGVTFSGGECMLYPEFLAQIAKMCREKGISVAVDTAGCVPYESFEMVLPYTDLFLYDIKCLNSEQHKKGTGKDNVLILDNLERLQNDGAQILIRVPVIPGFNEGEEVERIRTFCNIKGLTAEFLPYHSFGEGKKTALVTCAVMTQEDGMGGKYEKMG